MKKARTKSVTYIILVMVFSLNYIQSNCADSTFISIQWNGPQDKPHYGFIFHRKGIKYDARTSDFGNPFNLHVELTDTSFERLKDILFKPETLTRNDTTYRLYMHYYVGLFDGNKWILGRPLETEKDYLDLYRCLSTFLKGTKYELDFHRHWVSERAGLPTGTKRMKRLTFGMAAHNI